MNNPGGDALMEAYGGQDEGLPYYAALDENGKLVADSRVVRPGKDGKPEPPTNMAFPLEATDIQHFLDMLHAANPRVSLEMLKPVKGALIEAIKTPKVGGS